MIEAYCTFCLGASVFKPVQVLLGIDFVDTTPAREGEDLVAELHTSLDEPAAKGDVHDRAMRGVDFVSSFLKTKPTKQPESGEVAAAELATAWKEAAEASKAAKVKDENPVKVLTCVKGCCGVAQGRFDLDQGVDVTVGYREWLRDGTSASLHEYKLHFSVDKRDRLA